ncbi:hypothetical protein L3V82_04195 [Thiotrichales bacterium 19S3-7]|nr:hypothetical protein [Thiotrichales bacterium 19S3-7]MCF6802672.1 hypothetical protein [Thiotrichales bacterium 19S3-11]
MYIYQINNNKKVRDKKYLNLYDHIFNSKYAEMLQDKIVIACLYYVKDKQSVARKEINGIVQKYIQKDKINNRLLGVDVLYELLNLNNSIIDSIGISEKELIIKIVESLCCESSKVLLTLLKISDNKKMTKKAILDTLKLD